MLAIWQGDLEIRQIGGVSRLIGSFPYGTLATVSDRGRVRKESIASGAFRFAIDDPERRIDILVGHDFGKPIASRAAGTLDIEDTVDAVRFEARLPDDPPSWVTDAEKSIRAGIMTGLSPGFRVPPRSVVSDAETLIPEPGNPTVSIRQINHAMLREFSIVTSGAYLDAAVDLRSEDGEHNAAIIVPRPSTLWL